MTTENAEPDPEQAELDRIKAAVRAGHVSRVCVFCDRCRTEYHGDFTGETREIRFAAAREYLVRTLGWTIGGQDLCPGCTKELKSEA